MTFRQQFSSPETRTVLSVLMCARDRATVLRLLDEACPDDGAVLVFGTAGVSWRAKTPETQQSYAELVDGTAVESAWKGTIFQPLTIDDANARG